MKRPTQGETQKRKNLLLSVLKRGPRTANETIEMIYRRNSRLGWKFYLHLNKLFSPLEKEGKIKNTGKNSDGEKVWEVV